MVVPAECKTLSASSDLGHFVDTTTILKVLIGTEVGDFRPKSVVQDLYFSCANEGEQVIKHALSQPV